MLPQVKTYRDNELYLILNETCKMFNEAQDKLDFKNIAVKNNITNTVWALVLLSFRLRWLCESILSCTEYYSVSVIYRAFIEHSVKHKYILISCIKKGDDIGKEYVSSEHMSYEMLQKFLRIQWPSSFQSPGKLLKPDEFNEFKRRARETANQFKFSEVMTSILGLLDQYYDDEIQKVLRSIIIDYSTLSSYVHAGPIAVLDLEKKPKKNIDMGSMLLTTIAYNDIIRLLSLFPSEHQDKLKTLNKRIDGKVKKALAIYGKNYIS